MSAPLSSNCTLPATDGKTVALRISTVPGATPEGPAGAITSRVMAVAAGGAAVGSPNRQQRRAGCHSDHHGPRYQAPHSRNRNQVQPNHSYDASGQSPVFSRGMLPRDDEQRMSKNPQKEYGKVD